MTKALKKAFETASRLPDHEQDELAAAILEELSDDERWAAAFARSQDALEGLADEALQELARITHVSTSNTSTPPGPSTQRDPDGVQRERVGRGV
jgi:hypothetical protein